MARTGTTVLVALAAASLMAGCGSLVSFLHYRSVAAPTIRFTLKVGATQVAVASDGHAWFGTADTRRPTIGLVSTQGTLRTRPTPLPVVALATSANALYATEITADDHAGTHQFRVEKFDLNSLRQLASRELPDPTGLAVAADDLWVASPSFLYRLRATDLALIDRIGMTGSGWSSVLPASGAIWVLNNTYGSGDFGHTLHRFDPDTPKDVTIDLSVYGSGSGALASDGRRLWAFLQSSRPASGTLLELDASGMVVSATDIPGAPGGIAVMNGAVWWASDDGSVGELTDQLRLQGEPISLGTDAACLTAGAGYLWACTADGLELVQPAS